MPNYTLLISNPPHGAVDAARVAAILDLVPAEVALKANYAIPEIWLADTDHDSVRSAAAEVSAAGVHAVIASSEQLLAIRPQELVRSFALADSHFTVVFSSGRVDIPFDSPVILVVATPWSADDKGDALATTSVAGIRVPDVSAFVDLYIAQPHGVLRATMFADVLDFGGLGDQKGTSKVKNLLQLAQLLETRLTHPRVDRRLTKLQLRRKYRATSPTLKESRRGYSFASRGLTELLDAISPTETDVSQAEFSSRLVFLTTALPRILPPRG